MTSITTMFEENHKRKMTGRDEEEFDLHVALDISTKKRKKDVDATSSIGSTGLGLRDPIFERPGVRRSGEDTRALPREDGDGGSCD